MPKLTPKTGHAGAGEAAQRVQDRAVAAEDQAEVDPLRARRRPRSIRSARSPCLARSPGVATICQPASAAAATATSTASVGRRRVRVGDQRRRLHASRAPRARRGRGRRAPRPRARTRRRSRCCPSARAARRGRSRARRGPRLAGRLGDAEDRLAAVARVADDAPADPLAAELELRLDHRQQLAARLQAGDDGGQDLGQRDEGDVDRREVGRRREGREGSISRALSRSITVTRGRRAATGRSGRRRRRRAATRAAPRCSMQSVKPPVEAPTSRQSRPSSVDPERLERVVELDPAARDEARAGVDEQIGLGLDQLAGPQRDRAVAADPDLARPHRAGGRRARREQPALGENRVYAGLLHRRNGTAPPRAARARLRWQIFMRFRAGLYSILKIR